MPHNRPLLNWLLILNSMILLLNLIYLVTVFGIGTHNQHNQCNYHNANMIGRIVEYGEQNKTLQPYNLTHDNMPCVNITYHITDIKLDTKHIASDSVTFYLYDTSTKLLCHKNCTFVIHCDNISNDKQIVQYYAVDTMSFNYNISISYEKCGNMTRVIIYSIIIGSIVAFIGFVVIRTIKLKLCPDTSSEEIKQLVN